MSKFLFQSTAWGWRAQSVIDKRSLQGNAIHYVCQYVGTRWKACLESDPRSKSTQPTFEFVQSARSLLYRSLAHREMIRDADSFENFASLSIRIIFRSSQKFLRLFENVHLGIAAGFHFQKSVLFVLCRPIVKLILRDEPICWQHNSIHVMRFF